MIPTTTRWNTLLLPPSLAYLIAVGTGPMAPPESVKNVRVSRAYAMLFELTGTGTAEALSVYRSHFWSPTGPRLINVTDPTRSVAPFMKGVASATDEVRFIQASLGLTVAQLSLALEVQRQTVYAWLQAEEPPKLQDRTRKRLGELSAIAREWNQSTPWPAGKLAETLDLGHGRLIELLSRPTIDREALREAMQRLAQHVSRAHELKQTRLHVGIPPPETSDDRVLRRATAIPLKDDSQSKD